MANDTWKSLYHKALRSTGPAQLIDIVNATVKITAQITKLLAGAAAGDAELDELYTAFSDLRVLAESIQNRE